MADNSWKETNASVDAFLKKIADPRKRADAFAVLALMKKVTRQKPKMWGSSMVGFGKYHYKYASGHEGDCFAAGFSPRKTALTLYIMTGFQPHAELLAKLGKFKTGKACLYIKRLDDVHLPTLRKLVSTAVSQMKKRKPA